MKKALIEYSKAFVVPENPASQPASGIPAIPASPVSTASARIAKRSSESVDSLNRGVVMAVIFDPFFVGLPSTGAGVDAATSVSGDSGPGSKGVTPDGALRGIGRRRRPAWRR